MPLPPPPTTYRCTRCSFTRTVRPRSDALVAEAPAPTRCPDCGHAPLSSTTPSRPSLSTAQIVAQIRQLIR